MLKKIIFLVCIYGLNGCSYKNSKLNNNYEFISHNLDLIYINKNIVTVTTDIHGKFNKKIIINLPDRWADVSFRDQIQNIELIYPEGLKFKVIKADNHQLIISLPFQTNLIKFKYNLIPNKNGESNIHKTLLAQDFFQSAGYGIFSYPEQLDYQKKINTQITFSNIPQGCKALNSYNHQSSINKFLSSFDIINALYVVAKVRDYNLHENPDIKLALYGKFKQSDVAIKNDIELIFKQHNNFFKKKLPKLYLVSLIEGTNESSMTGTRLNNAFTIDIPFNMEKINYNLIFAHENIHNWISSSYNNENSAEIAWFVEGFTDYYTRVLSARSGAITFEEFIKELNKMLSDYYLSPELNVSNNEISKKFWSNYNIQKMPYLRGCTLAIYLNDKIKTSSAKLSLDDFLHDILEATDGKPFTDELFNNILRKYLGKSANNFTRKYITNGETLKLDNINLPLLIIQKGVFDLGFDEKKSIESGFITDINRNSNAFLAGIRNGDRLLKIDYSLDEAIDNIKAKVKTDKDEYVYNPQSHIKSTIYQIKDNLNSDEIKRIKEFFGVE